MSAITIWMRVTELIPKAVRFKDESTKLQQHLKLNHLIFKTVELQRTKFGTQVAIKLIQF